MKYLFIGHPSVKHEKYYTTKNKKIERKIKGKNNVMDISVASAIGPSVNSL
jgi:hypothetical protein